MGRSYTFERHQDNYCRSCINVWMAGTIWCSFYSNHRLLCSILVTRLRCCDEILGFFTMLQMPFLITWLKLWRTFVQLLHVPFFLSNPSSLKRWRLVPMFLYVMQLIVLFSVRFTMAHFLSFLTALPEYCFAAWS